MLSSQAAFEDMLKAEGRGGRVPPELENWGPQTLQVYIYIYEAETFRYHFAQGFTTDTQPPLLNDTLTCL